MKDLKMKICGARNFILGMVAMALIFSLAMSVSATLRTRQATLFYNDIQIDINGTLVTLTDLEGNVIEPFIMDNVIYVPVSPLVRQFGYTSTYDGANGTLYIRSGAADFNDWLNYPRDAPVWTANMTSVVIHRIRECSNMSSPIQWTKEDALARSGGGRPCINCWTNRGYDPD